MLLDSIRNCGKIFAVVFCPSRPYVTMACRLVFFDVAGAENLLRQFRDGRFIVNGYMPRVVRNRFKTLAQPPSHASRVLHIKGPSCIINQPNLSSLFRSGNIVWQDEEVIVLSHNGAFNLLEWRFASYRRQAATARHLINRMKREPPVSQSQLWQQVTVRYGVDPCAPRLPPNNTMSSRS
ncbi:hypothetical protein F5Y09DRAFT_303740 [Xylaria sp. FL1042]|nr:hypothetical protein F5Y09DRAFT_303740 [Xylaria sp. FL1042]